MPSPSDPTPYRDADADYLLLVVTEAVTERVLDFTFIPLPLRLPEVDEIVDALSERTKDARAQGARVHAHWPEAPSAGNVSGADDEDPGR
jgi:hypothetical protein